MAGADWATSVVLQVAVGGALVAGWGCCAAAEQGSQAGEKERVDRTWREREKLVIILANLSV